MKFNVLSYDTDSFYLPLRSEVNVRCKKEEVRGWRQLHYEASYFALFA